MLQKGRQGAFALNQMYKVNYLGGAMAGLNVFAFGSFQAFASLVATAIPSGGFSIGFDLI